MILHIVISATLYNVLIEEKVSIPQRQVALAHLGGAQQVHGKVLSLVLGKLALQISLYSLMTRVG